MASAVKVAVRVRPFNSREETEGAVLCIEMHGNMTRVYDKSTGFEKKFFFDYSYWSHNAFAKDPNTGYMSKDSPSSIYADQNAVFQDLGVGVLNNAWEGYHTCLFAYGQTGSGKSYSMVGYDANKGIIPITCEEIFKKIAVSRDTTVKYDVKVAMLEIYNEQVQDLLQPPSARARGGLKVREHPLTGVFVENLSKRTVGSYEEISAAFDTGNKHRTVAATQMNATSSRAHTVLTISFTQIFYDQGTGQPVNRKQSDINLVDLAGSERVDKTGATGERLQEGTNINKSLSTLGKVITALAKKSEGQLRGEMIPYRESKLTRILQNALGGNSKTTMIAAISPATFNMEVKAIKNQAIVNETPQEKLIRELREENERLKQLVEGRGPVGTKPLDEEAKREFLAQIEELKRAKEEAEKTAQERLDEAQIRRSQTHARVEVTTPHLMNLNEDPLLTGYIKHTFKPGDSVVGRPSDSFQPDIPVQGLGVEERHCVFSNEGGVVKLLPGRSDSAKVLVNGKVVKAPVELRHEDRVRIGNHLLFLYVDPALERNPEINWEFASREANESEIQNLLGAKEEEMRRKMREEQEQAQRVLEEERQKMEQLHKAKAQQDEETQKQMAEKEREMEARRQEMMEEFKRKEGELKKIEKDLSHKKKVEEELSNAFKLTNDASARAAMLGKKSRFKPEFYRTPGPDGRMGKGYENTHVRMRVLLPELDDSVKLYWNADKMEGRIPDMTEMTEQFMNGVPLSDINVGYDPFAVSEEDIEFMNEQSLAGQCNIHAQALYHMLDLSEDAPLFDLKGAQVGIVRVKIVPQLEEGLDMDEFENMDELLGHKLTWDFSIISADGLPLAYSKNVYCEYSLPWVSSEAFKTQPAQGRSPVFNYRKNHDFVITKSNSKEVMEYSITIFVYAQAPDDIKAAAVHKLQSVLGLPSSAPGTKQPAARKAEEEEVKKPIAASHVKPVLKPEESKKPSDMPAVKPDPPRKEPAKQPARPEESKSVPKAEEAKSAPKGEFQSKPSEYSVNKTYPDTRVVTSGSAGQASTVGPVVVASKELTKSSPAGKSGCCQAF